MHRFLFAALCFLSLGATISPGFELPPFVELKGPDEGELEVFGGAPSVFASDWNSGDRESYREILGTGATQIGGLVYQFVIPEGATSLDSITCTGKVGAVAAGNEIEYEVFQEDGTSVSTITKITATAKTNITISSFSPTPSLTEKERILVEARGEVDDTEQVFIGKCQAKFIR